MGTICFRTGLESTQKIVFRPSSRDFSPRSHSKSCFHTTMIFRDMPRRHPTRSSRSLKPISRSRNPSFQVFSSLHAPAGFSADARDRAFCGRWSASHGNLRISRGSPLSWRSSRKPRLMTTGPISPSPAWAQSSGGGCLRRRPVWKTELERWRCLRIAFPR